MNMNPIQAHPESPQELSQFPGVPRRKFLTTLGAAAAGVLVAGDASAKSPLKLTKWMGTIDFTPGRVAPFQLEGTASHLGQFTAYGEVAFRPGPEAGSLLGEGIVVFAAANGDLLAGVLGWDVTGGGAGGHIHDVRWRDSVEFADGRIVFSTGRFVNDRPPGILTLEYLILASFLALALLVGVSSSPSSSGPRGSR